MCVLIIEEVVGKRENKIERRRERGGKKEIERESCIHVTICTPM
jgi:hypothetical protein